MRGRRGAGWASLGLALALHAAVAAVAVGETRDPSCATVALPVRAGTLDYALPSGFIAPGSDSVASRSLPHWRSGTDYRLDALRGIVRVLRPVAAGETLWVTACRLLNPPPLEVALREFRPAPAAVERASAPDSAAGLPTRPSTARDPGGDGGGAVLAVTGNKTVAVDFGSAQDAALRQSLDLAVSGTLAPGVELTGLLSDRNVPVTAQGTTQDLQSLDRILVELRSRQVVAALGDIPLALDAGEFARLDRRLQGARAEWTQGPLRVLAAAASAQGEYRRLQLLGEDGRQGPYLLTDRDGAAGITVVAGSEVVTLDGERLTRGEGADYAIDYERARLTFSNKRPISSSSRITIEYQFAVNRYRRNLSAVGARWERGPLQAWVNAATEGDDRGRPLDLAFDADDRAALVAAGDSAALAIGSGVTAGVGDYDSVRVAGGRLAFAYAGSDSGSFAVRFVRVGDGRGDYADSALVSGRVAFRFVGDGFGAFRTGRALPLPVTQRLAAAGARARAGILALEVEAAASRRDQNTFSNRDDADDAGFAGRATLSAQGALPGQSGRAGVAFAARGVDRRFQPMTRLERPFAEEDWGLSPGRDLEHQRRVDGSAWWRPFAVREDPGSAELRGEVSRLSTPDGYRGWRRLLEWSGGKALATRATWARSDGTEADRAFADAGRERLRAEARWTRGLVWPLARYESDRRRFAADSGRAGDRQREWGGELASGARVPFRLALGAAVRREARLAGDRFVDQRESRLWRAAFDSPATRAFTATLAFQRRDVRPLADSRRTRSDLASARLRGEDRARGLSGAFDVEVTSEGENRRTRELRFVGVGRGGYDAFGNFVGTGDYDLVLIVSDALDRVARTATSARAGWRFGASDAWRGSSAEFSIEAEARRRGALRGGDVLLSTGLALVDPGLARGAITQRLDVDLAPGSRSAATRVKLERRVLADRSFTNFGQTTDLRAGQLRMRAQPGRAASVESEWRTQWQRATQSLAGGGAFGRTIVDHALSATATWTPDARLRVGAFLEGSLARPAGRDAWTRTVRTGPDLGVSVGARGRVELSARRAFVTGAAAEGLLPGVDPAGAPRWDATLRADVRVRESTTFGITTTVRERPGRAVVATGRAELRAFF